jgi:outer membrane protein assembly factor BamB
VVTKGPSGISWQTALKDAFPLADPPLDEALYGSEVAIHMMHQHVGVGSGVSPVKGILYAGSDRFTVNAINAYTGQLIWRTRTQNANFGQPIVTPNTVVVSNGDPWLNLGGTGTFRTQAPSTKIGDNWGSLRGFDPTSGFEKWTIYSALGTSGMTPLYSKGNLYWVNGQGRVWAVNADSGAPVSPFMDADGLPVLSLGGFNAISSANVYRRGGTDIMVVGMTMPNRMVAINLSTATILWTQNLATFGTTYLTGFSTVPPAVSQSNNLVVSTVLINADVTANTITQLVFALNAQTGAVVWTQPIGTGPIPVGGFVGPTPLLDSSRVYLNNPVSSSVVALNLTTGAIQWQTLVTTPAGKLSWGPGVLVKGGKLIQPVGPTLYTLNATTGAVLNQHTVGGSTTYNHPTVIGKTLYIGNSWGWVMAIPLGTVTGNPADG